MIKTKEELKEYVQSDNSWFKETGGKTRIINSISSDNKRILKKFLVLLRKSEYHLNNTEGSRYHTYLYWYYEGRKNRLGRKLGIEIYPNCFGKGLEIWHAGGIVVNPGDIIVADRNGVCCIPRQYGDELLARLKESHDY